MNALHTNRYLVVVGALGLFACGDDDASVDPGNNSQSFPQCEATGYVAFDAANQQSQDVLSAYSQIVAWLDEAKVDSTLAADRFGRAKELYTDASQSASFRDEVSRRKDVHLVGKPVVGDVLDERLLSWFDAGIAADNNLKANVAKQWVDKSLQEFFFLSVHHELVQGTRKNWDEAFGYFGAGADNAEGALKGLAKTAKKRDGTNGTNLRAQIFNNLIDGSCELAQALHGTPQEPIDPATVPALQGIIADIDGDLQRILAYSAGHEAFDMVEVVEGGFDVSDSGDTDTIWIKSAELLPFVRPLLRLMNAAGGESAERASEISALFEDADFENLSDTQWMLPFVQGDVSGPARIIQILEAEYGIDIKG